MEITTLGMVMMTMNNINNINTSSYTGARGRTDTSSNHSDREPHRIRKYCGLARDWARKKWHGLQPPKPQVKPAWWLGMQHNLALSRLYQLPDEILLIVCRELEGSDVYIMRQTCSNFRRLLSAPEFVGWEKLFCIYIMGKRSMVEVPKAGVDWQDVYERLRRRRCCWACIDARLPKQIGGDSAYDTAMLRLANKAKYCTECRTQHPLIMFSKKQREAEDGAICIMAEGGVAICPHRTVSLRMLRDWQDTLRNRGDDAKRQAPPWFLSCDVCFREFEEPLRSSAVRPAATCLLPEAMGLHARKDSSPSWESMTTATQGALCVQWTMPLRVTKKVAVAAGTTSLDYIISRRDSHGAEKIEAALFQAAEAGYNELLCPHASFDNIPILRDYIWNAHDAARDFKDGCEWESRVDPTQGFVQRRTKRCWGPSGDGLCRICSRPGFLRPLYHMYNPSQRYEHRWVVSKHGLALQQQLTLPVPDLSVPFTRAHEVWLQMLSPHSYGLSADTDLQHITWCPDRRCVNGRSWATHQRHLDIINARFEDGRKYKCSLPFSAPRKPFDIPRLREDAGVEKMSWADRKEMMRQPYTFRGVRFLPVSD
ncbi:hypothetical protein PG993_008255 [Apiospora rasikravindrae]|uniref:F-box domain-containing protein n=1 Tax=Apiospora rasikravindrae TaxID=990691 RepID=A0ABR1T1N8_9PEZI